MLIGCEYEFYTALNVLTNTVYLQNILTKNISFYHERNNRWYWMVLVLHNNVVHFHLHVTDIRIITKIHILIP